jgi:TonB family protein
MRVALCLGIISLGSIVAVTKAQPSATPSHLTLTPADAARLSVYTPLPRYPIAARVSHIVGSGIFRLHVSLQTGLVKSLDIERSTGERLLDTAASNTLKKWRFKPEILRAYTNPHHRSREVIIHVPVNYTMR